MIILAIANQKGGVGKTTTAVNLGAGLALEGYTTLVVDLDIQASATKGLVGEPEDGGPNMTDVLLDSVRLADVVMPTSIGKLFLAPARETLAAAEPKLARKKNREGVLRDAFRDPALRKYSFVVIDTAPYLGLVTINGLVASHRVIIPVTPEYYPLLGLKLLRRTLEQMKSEHGAKFDILGYLITMYDPRERITMEAEKLLRDAFGDKVFPEPVRINTKLKAAPAKGQTAFEYEGPMGRGAEDYRKFTAEVLKRLGERG